MNTTEKHSIEIKTTRDGWHYATCSCGWRSMATEPSKRDDAALRGQIHVEVRT